MSQNIQPGQRWYDEKAEQHFIILGKNYIGAWLLQYEDGDIIEWNYGGIGEAPVDPHKIYKPAPAEIEAKRPTLATACDAEDHEFLNEPYKPPLERNHPMICGKCGLELEALREDLGQHGNILKWVTTICNGCGTAYTSGDELNHVMEIDRFLCDNCKQKFENGMEPDELLNQ